MDFSELNNVKLKKTKKVRDASKPIISEDFTAEHVKQHDDIWKTYDFENWFPLIEHVSFASHFLNLNVKDAQTILKWCSQKQRNFKEIGKLYTDLDTMINDIGKGEGVFVKLSSRSAKDATDAENRLQESFREKVKAMTPEEKVDDNALLTALLQAATDCMRVTSAEQVFSMFANSDRIAQDLETILKYPDDFQENIVIRKWVHIDIDMEFRCFVCKNVFTALCQYNYTVVFERLKGMKAQLLEQIVTFWEKECRDVLASKYEDYVIDIAVCDSKCYVIELNPWQAGTDAALFSWKKEANILENPEREEIQFRLADHMPENMIKQLPITMRELMNSARGTQAQGEEEVAAAT